MICSLRSRRFRSSVKWETRAAYIHLLISDKRGDGNASKIILLALGASAWPKWFIFNTALNWVTDLIFLVVDQKTLKQMGVWHPEKKKR